MMEKPTHYVEARILPLDGELLSRGDMAFVTTRIMTALHRAIVDGLKIAVSFPEFQERLERDAETKEVKLAGTGKIVRFFGSMNDLLAFIVRPDVASLIGEAACRLSGATPIREVPSYVAWETYSRDRAIERRFPGFLDRLNRRRVKRGNEVLAPEEAADDSHRSHHAHFNISSSSTGQRFSIFLRRNDVSDFTPARLSTYGIGVPVPVF